MTKEMTDVIQSIIDGVKYLIENSKKNETQIYNGRIIEVLENNEYKVELNTKQYIFKKYGNNSMQVNDIVKIFVPQNDLSMAFIM